MTTTAHTPRRYLRDAATICPAVSGSARCELDAGHEGLHKDDCAHWPNPPAASSSGSDAGAREDGAK